MPVIRRAEIGDLDAVAAIQSTSPEAAHWPVAEYMQYELIIAIDGEVPAGFLVWRKIVEGECELLNLVVAPECRRQGVASRLLAWLTQTGCSDVFLEVRESNNAARMFYKSMGFKEVNVRRGYYDSPPEAAIVMKFHSC